MTYDRFTQSLTDALPPKGITDLLTALWWEKKGDWHKAHIITQEIHTNDASLIHAYLHRKEGDLGKRTVESIIVHHADFVSFEPFKE